MLGAVWLGSFQRRSWTCAFAIGLSIVFVNDPARAVDIAVPEGFVVAAVAGDDLAHDAFTLTLDSQGRPVVSGPGYIRTLIDDDRDGNFDRFVTWANLPVQGAQGLWAEGNAVYWVGDKGLWRSEDTDGDLVSDTSPVQLLALPTGGEHDSHAIRRGPDGFWYLIAGNYAADIQKLNNDRDAAVKKARAGTIWRISPDFSKRAVWAHGLRNAYDFDFLANGQIVTYDSDEEREVTLPWYRPTRLLVVSPGSDAGWVDSAWFDTDHRVTMPQVISRLGRGSPTGVAVYHHDAFPTKYREAAFVLDWTFGRVIAVYPQPIDATEVTAKPSRFMAETFMQATGTAGFAPTDVCVEPSGSLLVCFGGRGTAGGLYRVRFAGASEIEPTPTITTVDSSRSDFSDSQLESLASILAKPCPWESWSVAQWRAELDEMPEDALAAMLDGRLKISGTNPSTEGQWRRRAAQLLVYTDRKPSVETLMSALASSCPTTRSAICWLIGRSPIEVSTEAREMLFQVLQDSPQSHSTHESPWDRLLGGLVWRQQHEAFGLRRWSFDAKPLPVDLDWQQRTAARQIQLWALSRGPSNAIRQVSSATGKNESLDSLSAKALYGSGTATIDAILMDRLAQQLSGKRLENDPQAVLEALTILQTTMGDLRHFVPLQSAPPQIDATDGYRVMYSRKIPDNIREGWTQWCLSLLKPSDSPDQIVVETEVLRTIAMLEPISKSVVEYCLSKIDENSHPTSDLHMLIVLGCCKASRDAGQSRATANALPALLEKVFKLGLNTDNSWTKRLEQTFKPLVQRDPGFTNFLVQEGKKIESSTLFWLEWCPESVQAAARTKIHSQLVQSHSSSWNSDTVRFATKKSVDPALLKQVRKELVSPPTLLAMELLSKSPTQADYPWMLDGLANATRDVWPSAWKGLSRMQTERPVDEFRTLAVLWAKLRNAPMNEISTTSLATRLRSSAWKLQMKNVPTKENWDEWMAFFLQHLDEGTMAKLKKLNGPQADWLPRIQESDGFAGDVTKGQALFERAKCSQCHGRESHWDPVLQESPDVFRVKICFELCTNLVAIFPIDIVR